MRRARRRGGRRRSAVLGAFSAAACLAALLAACGPASDARAGRGHGTRGRREHHHLRHAAGRTGQLRLPVHLGHNSSPTTSTTSTISSTCCTGRCTGSARARSPYLNPTLSLAKPPTYHGNEVIIQLKPNYKWSDGEPVDARDVVFFMNMMFAEAPTANTPGCNELHDPADCKYWVGTTGDGLPSDVSDVRVASQYVVTMRITTPKFSEAWFTNNELSQITPMPMAWDRTAAGNGTLRDQVSPAAEPSTTT